MSSMEEDYANHAKELQNIIQEWLDLTTTPDLDKSTITNITDR